MNDPTPPLNWSPDAGAPAAVDRAGPASEPYRWPTPPFAAYPATGSQKAHEPCEILGLNGRTMRGRLSFFQPEEELAHVQVPPARTTMPLRFSQFRSITLTEPLKPQPLPENAPHAQMLDQRPRTPYRMVFRDGSVDTGETIGHVESTFGIFLFPPIDEEGRVLRMFVPHGVLSASEIGPRIGEVLMNQLAATQEQIAQAVDMQSALRGKKLGDILLTKQIVSPDQLMSAIEQQSKMPMVRIGEALMAMNLIDQGQLDEALSEQQRDRSTPLGELLVRMGMVSRADLQTALARKMGYPLVDVQKFPIESEALRKVPLVMAARLHALPIAVRPGALIVALDNPSDRGAIDELEFAAQCKVVPVIAQHGQITLALHEAYARIGADVSELTQAETFPGELEATNTDKLVETLEREGREQGEATDDKQIEQSDNSLVRLINTMIVEAYNEGVSDIHIECYPGREKLKIRFRKDGILKPYLELPHTYRNAAIARIKIMCDLDISERRKPQDGKINFSKFSPGHKIELRVATIPTNNGVEDVVMRILASAKPLPLDKLGLSPWNLRELKTATERPYGLVLCVGPTGSGKTTTLHSALSHINVPERKIWTAEDPVEITQPGLRQVQVNPKIDWTFAKALRAFLRADPDVVMVGEVRDGETAQMAVEASLTGHLVMSTLHTNSAPETVTRLLDMGMDPFNFADALLAVLAQRLVRRVCPSCRSSRRATDDEVEEWLEDYLHVAPRDEPAFAKDKLLAEWRQRLGRDGHLVAHHAPGCDACGGTGYKGRAGLHELMVVSRALRRLIQTGARAEDLQRQAMLDGMRTLRQDGLEKVLMGITTIDEVRATSNA